MGAMINRESFAVMMEPDGLGQAGASAFHGAMESYSSIHGASSTVVPSMTIWDALVHSPVFWSSAVMVTIVALLAAWESLVEYAREATPKEIEPVIEKMLGEMGSLGFVGIVISLLLNRLAFGEEVARLSEEYLGGREVLLETFEFLHEGEAPPSSGNCGTTQDV